MTVCPTDALNALPNVLAAVLKSKGMMAFGIFKINSATGSVPWMLRTSPYLLQSTLNLKSFSSHTCAFMCSVLALLDGSWGTVGVQAIYYKKLQICQASHIWGSCFLAIAPLSHLLKHYKETFLSLTFHMLVSAGQTDQSISTWRWRSLNGFYWISSIIQLIWCEYLF